MRSGVAVSPSKNFGLKIVYDATVGRGRCVVKLVDDDVVERVGRERSKVFYAAKCLHRGEEQVRIEYLAVMHPSVRWKHSVGFA